MSAISISRPTKIVRWDGRFVARSRPSAAAASAGVSARCCRGRTAAASNSASAAGTKLNALASSVTVSR